MHTHTHTPTVDHVHDEMKKKQKKYEKHSHLKKRVRDEFFEIKIVMLSWQWTLFRTLSLWFKLHVKLSSNEQHTQKRKHRKYYVLVRAWYACKGRQTLGGRWWFFFFGIFPSEWNWRVRIFTRFEVRMERDKCFSHYAF